MTSIDLYKVTSELRIVVKAVESAGLGTNGLPVDTQNILQQKWVCVTSGEIEWRDVPTVDEYLQQKWVCGKK